MAIQKPPAFGLLDSLLRSSTASCIGTPADLTSHLESSWSPLVLRSCPSGRKLRPLSESLVIVLSLSPAAWKAGVQHNLRPVSWSIRWLHMTQWASFTGWWCWQKYQQALHPQLCLPSLSWAVNPSFSGSLRISSSVCTSSHTRRCVASNTILSSDPCRQRPHLKHRSKWCHKLQALAVAAAKQGCKLQICMAHVQQCRLLTRSKAVHMTAVKPVAMMPHEGSLSVNAACKSARPVAPSESKTN